MGERQGGALSALRAPAISFVAALLAASIVFAGDPWIVAGRVVGISDGDTITILDRDNRQHKIRLSGIDAPEKGQAFGERSRQNLAGLVHDRLVDAHCHKRDRYGREVCKVMRGGTDANPEQIRVGMAWWYREYAREQSAEDRASYTAAAEDARLTRRGLWKDAKPVPP